MQAGAGRLRAHENKLRFEGGAVSAMRGNRRVVDRICCGMHAAVAHVSAAHGGWERTAADTKKAGSLDFAGLTGLRWTASDYHVVAMGGLHYESVASEIPQ